VSAPASAARLRVAIDLVPIHAGRGGAGGGIWSYASALVRHLDRLAPPDLELLALARADQVVAEGLTYVQVVRVDADTRSLGGRLRWVHLTLPALCTRLGVDVLHKLATEVPAWLPPRSRLVTTVHDFMPEFYREHLRDARGARVGHSLHAAYFRLMAWRAFARSHVVITDSHAVADEARRRFPGCRAELATVHLGVEPWRPADRQPSDQTRILVVGAFLPHKGQLLAVRAFERLATRHPELARRATLVFRGAPADAAYHATVRSVVATSPMRERVIFLPYEASAGPAAIYADADVLLLLSAYEGFGLPPLEAQAAGVPVVCSDIPVFREVLGDGARFVARDDADAVAESVAALLHDVHARRRQVAAGATNAARFAWDATARATADRYRATVMDTTTVPRPPILSDDGRTVARHGG
jgi:glycosyltransferase involved in cell wall biosynthesis